MVAELSLGELPWSDILVPLVSAGFGAGIGATVARHLRRQELYVEAAQRINAYIDEAVEELNSIDRDAEFDVEPLGKAKRAVNLARFHSRRLESEEVTNRLGVTDFVLWDVINNEEYSGVHWVYASIDDVMAAVVEFMVLPRLLPPRRHLREIPRNMFPNTSRQYRELGEAGGDGRVTWSKLRSWALKRQRELVDNPDRRRKKADQDA